MRENKLKQAETGSAERLEYWHLDKLSSEIASPVATAYMTDFAIRWKLYRVFHKLQPSAKAVHGAILQSARSPGACSSNLYGSAQVILLFLWVSAVQSIGKQNCAGRLRKVQHLWIYEATSYRHYKNTLIWHFIHSKFTPQNQAKLYSEPSTRRKH